GPASGEDTYVTTLQRDNPKIIFTGAATGRLLEELFSNAYLFVLPSEIEGLSHALLQALSFGRAVLASDIDAYVESRGGGGGTVRSRDVADLQARLQHLVDHPEVVRACAAGGRAHVAAEYSWDRVVDRLEAIYADVCPAAAVRTAAARPIPN